MAPVTVSVSVSSPSASAGDSGGDVSAAAVAAARHLYLPAVLDFTTPTALLIFLLLFLALSTIARLRDWLSPARTGLSSGYTRSSLGGRKTPVAHGDDERFGPETKTRLRLDDDLATTTATTTTTAFSCPPHAAMARDSSSSSSSSTSSSTSSSSTSSTALRPPARRPTPHAGPAATVALPQGHYAGVLLPASASLPRPVEAWRGIPYAQSTAGANRFRPPVPLSADAGASVTVADTFGQICPGSVGVVPGIAAGEDCLNLNVYRPAGWAQDGTAAGGGKGLMPVVVYVHGGAFNAGMGTERDMASLVGWAAATPVLGINFNYRVGALGFPSCAAAAREGCLNLGLRDQQMLFAWVRDNVAAFGGDPGRVTLMGLSAGAHSIGYHLQYYTAATAPFHAAILESGGATARATLAPSHPRTEAQWREFLAVLGIQPGAVAPGQLFALLRTLPLDALLRASNTVFSRYQDPVRWPFQPVVAAGGDDPVIPDLPVAAFRRGRSLRVPILTGFCTNEGTVFCSPRVGGADADFRAKFAALVPGLSPADLAALSALYPDPAAVPGSPYAGGPPGFGRQWRRYEAAYAHYAYICPVLQTGHFYSGGADDGATAAEEGEEEEKEKEKKPAPVWVYHFAARSRPEFGGTANHGDQAALVAHDMGALGAFPGLVATADAMHGAWVRFIATGDPNPSPRRPADAPPAAAATATNVLPFWPPFRSPLAARGGGRGEVMVFGAGNDERMGDAGGARRGTPARVARLTPAEVAQCRFWWDRVELSEGMGRRLGGDGRARL